MHMYEINAKICMCYEYGILATAAVYVSKSFAAASLT